MPLGHDRADYILEQGSLDGDREDDLGRAGSGDEHHRGQVIELVQSRLDETAHLYLGADLEPAEAEPDDTEFIERARMPLEQVLAMVLDGEITDSMTIIAVLHVARRLGV